MRSMNLSRLLLVLSLWSASLQGAEIDALFPRIQSFFPQATAVGALQGDPPAAPVFRGEQKLGYVFLTDDVVRIPAYSGKPIRTLVGFDLHGHIRGLSIVAHQEPILLVGVSDQDLQRYIDQYRGLSVQQRIKVGGAPRKGYTTIDGISGATITVMVLNASISRSVRKVAASRGVPSGDDDQAVASAGEEPHEAVWVSVWRERYFRIGILGIGLLALLVILTLQDWLARHPMLLNRMRTGYLVFTLVFIGWYALAQLSIVNVLTFVHSVMHGFRWDNFLIDPMMFILWSFVAVTLVLWGRGVYCGWLCPFGALQELGFRVGERLGVRSFEFPEVVHERLWALKYIILLGLVGLSLQSLATAERLVEVEPFKTAITLRFQREWGYVLYAGGLVVVSLFNRKFFCRYLCPLGAALTFPGRFRIFDWLRRRKECGRPCQICAQECEVRAIRETGEINPNECHYCLDCQVTYWNDRRCPPLVDKRRRREKSMRARELARGMEVAFTAKPDAGTTGQSQDSSTGPR
jgi:NosR/NirI family nitrous oxide reductase transcriptional regulator